MTITVESIDDKILCKFVPYGDGQRLWLLQADGDWYPSIGWCPHLNSGFGECADCGIVIEGAE